MRLGERAVGDSTEGSRVVGGHKSKEEGGDEDLFGGFDVMVVDENKTREEGTRGPIRLRAVQAFLLP